MVWGDGSHSCEEHFRRWVSGWGTACGFAASFASSARFTNYTVLSFAKTDVRTLDAVIDGAANAGSPALILFPKVRSSRELVRVLHVLDSGDRWTVRRIGWNDHARGEADLVRISWRTQDGLFSSVGGFAPLGSMPATRRAPYVALAVWGGGKTNPHKRTPGKTAVGFIDVDPRMDPTEHKKTWDLTKSRVEEVLLDPPEDVAHLHGVAFCVPQTAFADQPLQKA